MRFNQFDHWSPVIGGDASRISMVDDQGGEYFCIVPRWDGRDAYGRLFKDLRNRAVEVLDEAIEAGMEPGEYRWRS